jgi:hypothetical protein
MPRKILGFGKELFEFYQTAERMQVTISKQIISQQLLFQ